MLPPDVVKRNYYIEVCITGLANTHVSAISGGAGGGGGVRNIQKRQIASLKYISQFKFFKVRFVIDPFSCFSFLPLTVLRIR